MNNTTKRLPGRAAYGLSIGFMALLAYRSTQKVQEAGYVYYFAICILHSPLCVRLMAEGASCQCVFTQDIVIVCIVFV